MFSDLFQKCFKVSTLEQRDLVPSLPGDIVYVRQHPFVYLKNEDATWQVFTKVYCVKTHPKYNMNNLKSLDEPFMFKVESTDDLSCVPAKIGDLIYRNGDSFMYMKNDSESMSKYTKILKV